MTKTRTHISFSIEVQKPQTENEYDAVFLAPGTHNGLTFLPEDIARAASSIEGQPVNLNHSRDVEDEVGFVKPGSVRVLDGKLRGTIVLRPSTAKFGIAKAFIETRLEAGKTPEVSVGVFLSEDVLENGTVIARDLEFDHLALVTRGACSPDKGCGVGLSRKCNHMDDLTPEAEAPAPDAPAPAAETPAPEAPPAPEAAPDAPPAEPAPAPLAAEKPPCGCHELERLLLAEKETSATARAGLDNAVTNLAKWTAAYEALLASIPERLTLLAKARDLGLEATGAEDLAVLRTDLAKAERVAAHLAAKATGNPPAPATGPAPKAAASLADPTKPQDETGRKAASLLRAGGMQGF